MSRPARPFADYSAFRTRLLNWGREALIPWPQNTPRESEELTRFVKMIGDCRLLALGEATHGGPIALSFRNEVFEILVECAGFASIALESGFVEGCHVQEIVDDDACAFDRPFQFEHSIRNGLSWTFDRYEENRALIRWMREYNRRHRKKVRFYGFDVPGSPGNPSATRGVDAALRELLAFLDRTDPCLSAEAHKSLDVLLPYIRFDFHRSSGELGYDLLTQEERNRITAAIAKISAALHEYKSEFVKASSPKLYDRGCLAALGASQVDSWLQKLPLDWKPSSRPAGYQGPFFAIATDVRDRHQAENLMRILAEEQDGSVFMFASRFHVSAAEVRTDWLPENSTGHHVAGTFLRERLGSDYVAIGEVSTPSSKVNSSAVSASELEIWLAEMSSDNFLLDLRTAPREIRAWLKTEQNLGDEDSSICLSPALSFDILFKTTSASHSAEGY